MTSRTRTGDTVYWGVAIALVVLGIPTVVSIGIPLMLVGATLIALAGYRDRPWASWPWLAAVLSFLVAVILVVPTGCSTGVVIGSDGGSVSGPTTCSSLLGLDYSGGAGYSPSLWPALVAGTDLGALTWIATRALLTRRGAGGAPR